MRVPGPFTENPLFAGRCDLRITPVGVEAMLPRDVVIPPGYSQHVDFDMRSKVATYKVIKSPGWYAAYLRWRFPYRKDKS